MVSLEEELDYQKEELIDSTVITTTVLTIAITAVVTTIAMPFAITMTIEIGVSLLPVFQFMMAPGIMTAAVAVITAVKEYYLVITMSY